ncbi:MAG TPA: M20 family metallopeptidase [archaeon]|nr:M20 family metallopeptidase [archaeon]
MDVVELTQELVRINSENPPGNEKNVARYINDYLNDKGIKTEIVEYSPNRFNVVADIGSGDGLLLNGHLDTVPIGDKEKWEQGPLSGKIFGDNLFGRGSGDMKGAVAAMIKTVEMLSKQALKRRVVLALVADEEGGRFSGTNWLLKNRKEFFNGIKYGVVGESTSNKVRTSQKGFVFAKIKFYGKSAHGSKPDLGINAISNAIKFGLELENLFLKLKSNPRPILGNGTINIGTIKGGLNVNIVPDYCEMEVDRRLVDNENVSDFVSQMKEILNSLGIKSDTDFIGRNPMVVSENSAIVKMLLEAGADGIVSGSKFGYTEAELYSSAFGIECVVCGPGDITLAHAPNEFVSIKRLRASETIYTNLVKKWCC